MLNQKLLSTLLLCFSFVFALPLMAQKRLTAQQEAWLYRIVQKTEVLKNNCGTCFHSTAPNLSDYIAGQESINFDKLEQFHLHNPQSLNIDYQCLEQATPGVTAEISMKLAIWEFNENLKHSIASKSTNDTLFAWIANALAPALSKKINLTSPNKQTIKIIQIVAHPSLPLFRKIELLQKEKLDIQEQKELFDLWKKIVVQHVDNRTNYFFNMLNPKEALYLQKMLAAGEGSGTAGLLNEKEPLEGDSTRQGYGKAIGLFTYDVMVRRGKLIPRENTNTTITPNTDKNVALHFSVWGLNSTLQPMIVITQNNKSYQLFANSINNHLSPDPKIGTGITPIDRVERITELRISKPVNELNRQGGLISILEQEYLLRDKILSDIQNMEGKTDSLKNTGASAETINLNKTILNTYTTNLSKKETRIKELEQKITSQFEEIESQQKKIDELKSSWGTNPQTWIREGNLFHFEDGSVFNMMTQDFIPDVKNHAPLTINLISSSYSLEGTQKDEVQLYTSLTSAPFHPQPVHVHDTIRYQLNCYHHPDAFTSFLGTDSIYSILNTKKEIREIVIAIELNAPDENDRVTNYPDFKKEFKLPFTSMALRRATQIEITIVADKLEVHIKPGSDPVHTRLSQLSSGEKQKLGVDGYSSAANYYLRLLRGLYLAKIVEAASTPISNRIIFTGNIPDENLLKIINEIIENKKDE
jgi:hypothetical protein